MMKNVLSTCLILSVFFLTAFSTDKNKEKDAQMLTVNINYGETKEIKRFTIQYEEGLTALKALQYATSVETHPVGKYIFVTTIDGVQGERGKTAWYYTINGQSPKQLAVTKLVHPGDEITWIYKEDVCSKTVDGPLKECK